MFPAASDVVDRRGNALVSAYALHRPDGQWALLLVNKDKGKPHDVTVRFADASAHAFAGSVTQTSFGRDQYRWRPRGARGFPSPDGPPVSTAVPGGAAASYVLPRGSITVLRGTVS